MAVNPLLTLRSVEKSYAIGTSRIHVLNDVNLTVDPGDFVVIQGEDGSGKSALLNIVAGIECSSNGDVAFDGKAVQSDLGSRSLLGSHVSFLSPVFCLDAHLTIQETLHQPGLEKNLSVADALTLAGLAPHDNRLVGELDQITRRRVGTARAFMAKPRLILADLTPPPWGVAPSLDSLRVANQQLGSAVVVTSNKMVDVPNARIFRLDDGRMNEEVLTVN